MTTYARTTDPSTSQDAARDASCDTRTHGLVLSVLASELHAFTDEMIVATIHRINGGRPTPQRIRCARCELARAGRIRQLGKTRLASGKMSRTWGIA